MKPSRLFTHLWQAWALVALVWFGIQEAWALVTGHPENTLSWNVWRALKVQPHEHLSDHPALWVLSLGLFVTVVVFLLGHFWFKWWG